MTLLIWLAASSFLWGAVLFASGRILQRSTSASAAMRQWAWRGAAALLIAPWIAAPFVLVFGLGLAPAEQAATATVASAPTAALTDHFAALDAIGIDTLVVSDGGGLMTWLTARSLPELLLIVLIAGWLVRFVLAQLALRSLLGIVNLSREAEPGVAQSFVQRWAERLSLRPAPRLRVVAEQHSPFSYGVLRPTICVPEGMEQKLSPSSLDLVIGHESLHVARGDGWLRPMERVIADVLWFNPFAWLIRRELDVARELAVDEAVLAMSNASVAYARTLRDVAGFTAGLPARAPAASMSLQGGKNLMLRVSRTLSHAGKKPGRAVVVSACLMGIVGAPLAIAQVMMVAPAPPVPPIAPVAPAAPRAPEAPPTPEAPPAPVSSVAPVDSIAPAAPPAPPAYAPPASAATPATPMVAPAPPAPAAPVAPMAPPAPPVWKSYQPTTVSPPPLKDGSSLPVIEGRARISAPYGELIDPISREPVFHEGVDIAAALGSPIRSPVGGVVAFVGVKNGRGNVVEVQGRDGYQMSFSQMDETLVKSGDAVSAGQVIGTVGSSGRSTGPHLHLEVTLDGQTQDPEKVAGLALVAGN